MRKKEDYKIYFVPSYEEILATRVLSFMDLEGLFPGCVDVTDMRAASLQEWDMFRMLNPCINISTLGIQLDGWDNYSLPLRDTAYWIGQTGEVR